MKIGWSFCIVTAPNNEEILSGCISSILKEMKDDDNYEILVVGNPIKDNLPSGAKLKFVSFSEEIFHPNIAKATIAKVFKSFSLRPFLFKTGAISHKKNLAAKLSKYDKLCILHDYVGIESGWKDGFTQFGNDWDVCTNVILNLNGDRHRDWTAWDHPSISSTSNGEGACLLPYDKVTKYMYISGGYFCVKSDFF